MSVGLFLSAMKIRFALCRNPCGFILIEQPCLKIHWLPKKISGAVIKHDTDKFSRSFANSREIY